MGDCLIRIVIARDLLSKARQDVICSNPTDPKFASISVTPTSISWTRTWTADSTVRELVEGTPDLWSLYTSAEGMNRSFKLWDCTMHPPRDISDWPIELFPELAGPKSKTLHDAGCFPSGIWMVLPKDMTPARFTNAEYDDTQYNLRENLGASSGRVEFTNPSFAASNTAASSKPLPSQIMASVAQRFQEEDDALQVQTDHARAIRRENQQRLRQRQQERAAKLDQRIQRLEETSSEKNKNVSDQVRRMLVKSRATGDKRLEQQDRLYFECLLDKGSDNDDEPLVREFRFFSPQDTFAAISSAFAAPKDSGVHVEVLTKQKIGDGEEYRRFPFSMRVYEAIERKLLNKDNFDTIVIRWHAGDLSDATPCIVDMDTSVTDADDMKGQPEVLTRDVEQNISDSKGQQLQARDAIVDKDMTNAIQEMDEEINKGKKSKKSSAASIKVRQMQIKSKAKGDVKRIPKMEDRFYLEVILFDTNANRATSSFQFLSNKDPIERILHSLSGSVTGNEWEFFVPAEEGDNVTYSKILDTSTTLSDASEKGILKSFDRLILRPK